MHAPSMRSKSLAGKKVTYEQMREITKPSNEGKIYRAFGYGYSDFYEFYESEFPDAYPLPRVRLSQRVRTFLESSRPNPMKILLDEAKKKVKEDLELTLYEVQSPIEKSLLRVQMKKDKKKDGPYIDLYPNKKIVVLFNAEIYKGSNQLTFIPTIVSNAGGYYPREKLESRFLGILGLNEVKVNFPEQIRMEHLIAYDGYPYKEKQDTQGRPLWELSEVPVVRVSFISESTRLQIRKIAKVCLH